MYGSKMLKAGMAARTGSTQLCPHVRKMKISRQRRLEISNSIAFTNAPTAVLVGGGLFVIASAGFLISEALKAKRASGDGSSAPEPQTGNVPELRKENAVLVFGASGRSGKEIVKQVRVQGGPL